MNNDRVLELLDAGRIDDLRAAIMDEIYKNSLNKWVGAKERYAAMKRFFKGTSKNERDALRKPCRNVMVRGRSYNCFVDGHNIVCTTEDVGGIECFDTKKNDYFKVDSMVSFYGDEEIVNMRAAIAEAKRRGYKFRVSEKRRCTAAIKYREAYFAAYSLDKSYSIIDDGSGEVTVYYSGKAGVLILKTEIGLCVICPMNPKQEKTGMTITEIESKYEN